MHAGGPEGAPARRLSVYLQPRRKPQATRARTGPERALLPMAGDFSRGPLRKRKWLHSEARPRDVPPTRREPAHARWAFLGSRPGCSLGRRRVSVHGGRLKGRRVVYTQQKDLIRYWDPNYNNSA